MLLRLARHFLSRSTKFFRLLTERVQSSYISFHQPEIHPSAKFPRPNGGSLSGWLQGVKDDHWELAAIILAGLLAISLTLDCGDGADHNFLSSSSAQKIYC
jgi:hypothetical protein